MLGSSFTLRTKDSSRAQYVFVPLRKKAGVLQDHYVHACTCTILPTLYVSLEGIDSQTIHAWEICITVSTLKVSRHAGIFCSFR